MPQTLPEMTFNFISSRELRETFSLGKTLEGRLREALPEGNELVPVGKGEEVMQETQSFAEFFDGEIIEPNPSDPCLECGLDPDHCWARLQS